MCLTPWKTLIKKFIYLQKLQYINVTIDNDLPLNKHRNSKFSHPVGWIKMIEKDA